MLRSFVDMSRRGRLDDAGGMKVRCTRRRAGRTDAWPLLFFLTVEVIQPGNGTSPLHDIWAVGLFFHPNHHLPRYGGFSAAMFDSQRSVFVCFPSQFDRSIYSIHFFSRNQDGVWMAIHTWPPAVTS